MNTVRHFRNEVLKPGCPPLLRRVGAPIKVQMGELCPHKLSHSTLSLADSVHQRPWPHEATSLAAWSTEVYCDEHCSFEILSLMLRPWKAERCMVKRNLPSWCGFRMISIGFLRVVWSVETTSHPRTTLFMMYLPTVDELFRTDWKLGGGFPSRIEVLIAMWHWRRLKLPCRNTISYS